MVYLKIDTRNTVMASLQNAVTEYEFVDMDVVVGSVDLDMPDTLPPGMVDLFTLLGGDEITTSNLETLLQELLEADGKFNAIGVEGVDIVSLNTESFTISIEGLGGSFDYYTFAGTFVTSVIDSVAGDRIGLNDNDSRAAIFDTDLDTKIFIGNGPYQKLADNVSEDFADLVALNDAKNINLDEIDALLDAAIAAGNGDIGYGVEGVGLVSMTDDEFTLDFSGIGLTMDTIIFTGSAAAGAIANIAMGEIDVSNQKNEVGYFDVAGSPSFIVVGDQPSDLDYVSTEFNDLIFGDAIDAAEVLGLFAAIVAGDSNGTSGVDGVELVGLDNDSFTVALSARSASTDYIIFDNVDTLAGADQFGFYSDTIA